MLDILALLLVKDHQKTKDQLKSFDKRIINCTYAIQVHMLGIAVCTLIMLQDYPQSLTNADILGQGNLNLVSEKSGKSQGILLSIICGNPAVGLCITTDKDWVCFNNSPQKIYYVDIHCTHPVVWK